MEKIHVVKKLKVFASEKNKVCAYKCLFFACSRLINWRWFFQARSFRSPARAMEIFSSSQFRSSHINGLGFELSPIYPFISWPGANVVKLFWSKIYSKMGYFYSIFQDVNHIKIFAPNFRVGSTLKMLGCSNLHSREATPTF